MINGTFLKEITVAFSILSKRDRSRLALIVMIQIILGFLDLLGIALFGVLGALAVSGVESSAIGDRVNKVLEIVNIQDSSLQKQVMIVGILACSFLVIKTIFSMFLTKRISFYMNRKSADITVQLTNQLLSKDVLEIEKKSRQENIFHLTYGVNAISIGVVGSSVVLVSDIFLSLILFSGLVAFNFLMSLYTIIFFGIVAITLYWAMAIKAKNLGSTTSSLGIQTNSLLEESISMYKELLVSDRITEYISRISTSRHKLAQVNAELNFMGSISKYVIEISIVAGFMILSAIQFLTQDTKHAVATLAVFFAASTRIAPAVLRMQQGLVGIKSQLAAGASTLRLIKDYSAANQFDLGSIRSRTATPGSDLNSNDGFSPKLSVEKLTFSYPGRAAATLSNVSVEAYPGQIIAITGPSGGGKSTLLNSVLGVLPVAEGVVSISGMTPRECFKKWPGAVSYVSQSHPVIQGSVRENICLGLSPDGFTEDSFWEVLRIAHLDDYVKTLPLGLDSQVGDKGSRFSGGQKQRLGIARALLSKPKLLILDEATSALDNETESAISAAINAMRGDVTVVIVAHRLSSIAQADKIYYLESGKVTCSGTFSDLQARIPGFAANN